MPAAKLGADYERVTFTTATGSSSPGWYVPSRNRAAVIAFPGRNGPQAQTRDARRGTATACCCSTGAARARARATRAGFGWEGEKDIKAAIEFLQPPAGASTPGGSAASGCPSGAS